MAADGSIIIDTEINTDGFADGTADIKEQFEGMSEKVKDTSNAIKQMMEKPAKRISLTAQAEELAEKLDFAKAKLKELKEGQSFNQKVLDNDLGFDPDYFVSHDEYQEILDTQSAISKEIEEQQTLVTQLQKQYDSVNAKLEKQRQKIQQTNDFTEKQTAQAQVSASVAGYQALETQKAANATADMAEATRSASNAARITGNATQRSARAAEKLNRQTGGVAANMDRASRSMRRFGTRLSSIVTGALFFNVISSGLRIMVSGIWNAIASTNEMQQALANLRGAAYTAAAPLINVLTKAFVALANAAATALSYITKFYAFITGKKIEDLKEQGQQMGNLSTGLDNVATSTKKAKKALAGFDEIEKLSFDEDVPEWNYGSGTTSPNYGFGLDEEVTPAAEALLDVIGAVGAALAGLGIGKLLYQLGLGNDKLGMMLGSALSLSGAFLEAKGFLSSLIDGLNKQNFLEQIIGGSGIVAGGAVLGKQFGNALIGGGIGAIIAGIPMMISGIYDGVTKGLSDLSASLIPFSTTLIGSGIGALFGPVGAGVGGLLGSVMGLITDFQIWVKDETNMTNEEFVDSLAKIPLQTDAAFVGPMQDGIGFLFDWFKEKSTGIGDGFIESLATSALKVETQFTSPISDGLSNLFTWIKDNSKTIADGIVSSFGTAKAETDLAYILPTQEGFTNLFTWLGEKYIQNKDALVKMSEDAMFGQQEMYLTPTRTNFSDLFSWWKQNYGELKTNIITSFNSAKTSVMSNFISPLRSQASSLSSNMRSWFQSTCNNIASAFQTARNRAQAAFEGLASWFQNNVVNPIRNLLSSISSAITTVINAATNAWNNWNNRRSRSHGGFGGFFANGGVLRSGWGIVGENGPEIIRMVNGSAVITPLKVPYLASGAVIPPNAPFLAMLGDQKHGTNIEAPLETIQQAVAEVMGDQVAAMMAGFEAVVQAIQNKETSVHIGDRDIGEANARYSRRMAIRRGG